MTENINWKMATDETVKHLVRLIQTQTVNPPGNELPAIMVVKDILDAEGFPQEAVQDRRICPEPGKPGGADQRGWN